jgi:hypothetical protein
MDNETANRQAEQRLPTMPDRPGEPGNKASMQFIHGLIDGWLADHSYPIDGTLHYLWPRRNIVSIEPAPKRIERAPGFRLVGLLKFFCRKSTAERLIDPMHAEFLMEYYTALQEGRQLKATWVSGQMHCCLVKAVLSDRIVELLGSIMSGRFRTRPEK